MFLSTFVQPFNIVFERVVNHVSSINQAAWTNEQGEPTSNYKLTGWVWEIIGSGSRIQENYPLFNENLRNIPQLTKETPKDYNVYFVGLGNTRILTN